MFRLFGGFVTAAILARYRNVPAWLLFLDAQVLTNTYAPAGGVIVGWVGLVLFVIAPGVNAYRVVRDERQALDHQRARAHEAITLPEETP